MKKKFGAVLLAALILTGCNKETKSSSMPTELVVSAPSAEGEVTVDAFPAEVRGSVIEAEAQRVVSLSPAVTEILSEIGFSDRLVGISSYCDYPEGLSQKALGSTENPDIDGIIALKPDVVFTLSALAEREVYALELEGITVVMLDPPTSMEEFALLYRDISIPFYGKAQTEDEKKTELSSKLGNGKRTGFEQMASGTVLGSFVYVTGKGTLAGAGTFESAVLSLCGENMCGGEGYCEPSACEPKYIVADNSLDETALRENEAIAQMLDGGAVLLFVNSGRFERPSIRTAEVFAELSAQINDIQTSAE